MTGVAVVLDLDVHIQDHQAIEINIGRTKVTNQNLEDTLDQVEDLEHHQEGKEL